MQSHQTHFDRIPQNCYLVRGGSSSLRSKVMESLIHSSMKQIHIIENQEKTAEILFFLNSDERVAELTFEEAEKLVSTKDIAIDSGATYFDRWASDTYLKHPSGIIDLGPIPYSELSKIPAFKIDTSKKELIEQTIQSLIKQIFPTGKFTLEKLDRSYQFSFEEKPDDPFVDTYIDRFIELGIRLNQGSTQSFYLQASNYDLLTKLAAGVKEGDEFIRPLRIPTNFYNLYKAPELITKPSPLPTFSFLSGSMETIKEEKIVLPTKDDLNTALNTNLITNVSKGIFSSEAMMISFDYRKLDTEFYKQFEAVLLKDISGVKLQKSSCSAFVILSKKDYSTFMDNLNTALAEKNITKLKIK